MKKSLSLIVAAAFAAVSFGATAAPLTNETLFSNAGTLQLDVKDKKAGKKKGSKKKGAAKK